MKLVARFGLNSFKPINFLVSTDLMRRITVTEQTLEITFVVTYGPYPNPPIDRRCTLDDMTKYGKALQNGDLFWTVQARNPDVRSITPILEGFEVTVSIDPEIHPPFTHPDEGSSFQESILRLHEEAWRAFTAFLERIFWIPPSGPRIRGWFDFAINKYIRNGTSYTVDPFPWPDGPGSRGGGT
jgi:hypothetical protein